MSWDPRWDEVFSSRSWGMYPPEELIRFMGSRYYGAPDRGRVRVLELGCGPGPVAWYLAREGFDVHGVDGSLSAITQAQARIDAESLSANLRIGDFVELTTLYPEDEFHAVIDVTSVQHNRFAAVERVVQGVLTVLKPGGRFFGIMLAEGSYGYGTGAEIEPGTFVDIQEGPLGGMGLSHFFSENELRTLFSGFEELEINHSVRTLDNQAHHYKHWLVEARKPDPPIRQK